MAFPSVVSDLAATTIEKRSKGIADNVTAHNAVLTQMQMAGNIMEVDGGTLLQENFSFAENANAGSYSGMDTLGTSASDVLSAAQFQWAQYYAGVTISGREARITSGAANLIDLVAERVTVAENSLMNLINRHLYLDGTGNNGKNLTGLAAAIPLANTTGTYGGVDRSTAIGTFWRNQKFQATVDGSGVATAATLIPYWNTFIIPLSRGTDRPNLIVAGQSLYAMFQSATQPLQRTMKADSFSVGFNALDFQGIPVVFETVAAGLATSTAYFLNTKYLKLKTHKDANFSAADDKASVNQDATVKSILWMGNVTCSGAKFQGIFSNS